MPEGEKPQALIQLLVVLIVVSIAGLMGALILDEIRGTDNVLDLKNAFQANTSTTNASTMTLGHSRIVSSSLLVFNGTSGDEVSIPSSNYTLTCGGDEPYRSLCTLQITDYGGGWQETGAFNVNYTYQTPSSSYAYNSTVDGVDTVDTVMGFLPVIAIVVIAAVIIGIVVGAFAKTDAV